MIDNVTKRLNKELEYLQKKEKDIQRKIDKEKEIVKNNLKLKYKFIDDLYPSCMSYSNPFSLYQFFSSELQTKHFLKYLYVRLRSEFKMRKEDNYHLAPLALMDSNKASIIDIEYNFLVLVLADWVAHYSSNDMVDFEYIKYSVITET